MTRGRIGNGLIRPFDPYRPPVKGQIQGHINRLLAVDRDIAKLAIDEAKSGGGNEKKISTAEAEILKGDAEAAKDHPDKAVDHSRNAWKNAIGA